MALRTAGRRMAGAVSGRWSAWAVLLIAVALSGALLSFGGAARTSNDPTGALPASTESVQAAALARQLPGGQLNPALVVYSRAGDPLGAQDEAAITADAAALAPLGTGPISPPVYSPDRRAALLAVPLPADAGSDAISEAVERLRATARDGLPPGLTAQVSGGAGFRADVASSFDGANLTLLLVTVAVVAALLIVTYRSPWLWLVPLAVVGTADVVANALIAVVSRAVDLPIDPSTTGIVDVLVFGAGTNYALLLIARYREELRRRPDRRDALRHALTSAGPAIAA
ncbi:MMPL family transporter, partial [Micromonospora musae]|uniref:MMPL family transporter n=1 Tax=Micromonospora musae TaxID=1894970 RepID=UPI00341212DA